MTVKGMVVFAIFMSANEGIASKAPKYVREKFKLCEQVDNPENFLDMGNRAIFNDYIKQWDTHLEGE